MANSNDIWKEDLQGLSDEDLIRLMSLINDRIESIEGHEEAKGEMEEYKKEAFAKEKSALQKIKEKLGIGSK